MIKECFYCGEEIPEGAGRIVPLDIPYVNLWAHRGACADAMDTRYLQENTERIYKILEEKNNTKKKKKGE